jgi:hypothetical protein
MKKFTAQRNNVIKLKNIKTLTARQIDGKISMMGTHTKQERKPMSALKRLLKKK